MTPFKTGLSRTVFLKVAGREGPAPVPEPCLWCLPVAFSSPFALAMPAVLFHTGNCLRGELKGDGNMGARRTYALGEGRGRRGGRAWLGPLGMGISFAAPAFAAARRRGPACGVVRVRFQVRRGWKGGRRGRGRGRGKRRRAGGCLSSVVRGGARFQPRKFCPRTCCKALQKASRAEA